MVAEDHREDRGFIEWDGTARTLTHRTIRAIGTAVQVTQPAFGSPDDTHVQAERCGVRPLDGHVKMVGASGFEPLTPAV